MPRRRPYPASCGRQGWVAERTERVAVVNVESLSVADKLLSANPHCRDFRGRFGRQRNVAGLISRAAVSIVELLSVPGELRPSTAHR